MSEVRRVRMDIWADPETYLAIGPVWCHLWSRKTQEAIGQPTPQSMLTMDVNIADPKLVDYNGSLDPEDTE